MTPRPVDVESDAPVFWNSGRRLERERSFTVEQFGELVASALDVQRVPDSALAFSFGGNTNTYPPSACSTRSARVKDVLRNKVGTFSRLRGAFARKLDSRDSTNVPPNLHRLASSSVPTLAHLQLQTLPTSSSLISLDLGGHFLNSSSSMPTRPVDITSFPPTSPSLTSRNGLESRSLVGESSLHTQPLDERDSSSIRSFLNLKPLTVPNLTKKSSSPLVYRGLSPTLPEQSFSESPTQSTDCNREEPEYMRSFFDDSGYAERLPTPKSNKRGARVNVSSIFTSSLATSIPPSGNGHDKALPPTPVTCDSPNARRKQDIMVSEMLHTQGNSSPDRDSLFYAPPPNTQTVTGDQSLSIGRVDVKMKPEKERGYHRVSDWISRSANSTPRKPKRTTRSSPPPYPSPTSPLPPTPELLSSNLSSAPSRVLGHSRAPDGVGDTSEESIDSIEILSWRLPSLEQQVSKTSSTSSARAHALGRPSRGSIRERLGLGTRLHLHVPLPPRDLLNPNIRSKSQADYSRGPLILGNNQRLNAPPSSAAYSSSKLPIQRLASASFVSLRSITTITAGSRGPCEDSYEDRKDALAVDRAFTPEDDPFAADPLTPVTPVHTVFHIQAGKGDKHQSFMPLGNDSSVSIGSPDMAIVSSTRIPSWHYRLGSNSNVSSPALTPSSSVRKAKPTPNGFDERIGPANVPRAVTSSLNESLTRVRRRTPSTPSCPSISASNLARVMSRVRKAQNTEDMKKNNPRKDGNDSHVVGHSESRPHSPFPMLFLRTRAAKAIPTIVRQNKRASVVSIVSSERDEHVKERTYAANHPTRHVLKPLLARRANEHLSEPVANISSDADSLGNCSRNDALETIRRDMLSPTAWLLDSDTYEETHEDNAPCGGLYAVGSAKSKTNGSGKYLPVGFKEIAIVPELQNLQGEGAQYPSKPDTHRDSGIETDIERDISLLRASQSWPLPPHRTVVVNEGGDDGYHIVEPSFEYVRIGSVTDRSRHSIRFSKSKKQFGAAFVESLDSHRSQNDSPTSQKLSSSQARTITVQLGSSIHCEDRKDAVPETPVTRQLKQRSRSANSLTSTGARSIKTNKTAFYSTRSTASRGSDRSTFSFSRPHQLGSDAFSREGSSHSLASRSPPSSADHDAKTSTDLRTNAEFSICTRERTSATDTTNSTHVHEVVSIPPTIVLRPTGGDDAFRIVVSGWMRLLRVCAQYGNVSIEALDGGNEYKLLCVSVEESYDEDEIGGIRGIHSEMDDGLAPASEAFPFIRLSLSLHRPSSGMDDQSKVVFCLPLPATLGAVGDMLQQARPT